MQWEAADPFDRREEINAAVTRILKTRTTAERLRRFEAADIRCSHVNSYETLFDDPQVRHNQVTTSFEYPGAGAVRAMRHPVGYEAIRPDVRRRPDPRRGLAGRRGRPCRGDPACSAGGADFALDKRGALDIPYVVSGQYVVIRWQSMMPTIRSVEKAIDLLFLFDGDRTALDAKTIAATLGIPLRSTYRLLNTLRNRQVITIEERTGLFRLSPRLRRLLAAIEDSADLTRLAGPFLAELARTTGETAQLFIPHGDGVLLAETAESQQALRVGPRKGQHIPLHCGAGAKTVFAFQPPEEWDAYIRRSGLKAYAPNTVTDAETLTRQLKTIRRAGFAVSHQEFIPGVRSLGVPIRDATERAIGCLGLVGPESRLTRARARALIPQMLEAAERIAQVVRGQDAPVTSNRGGAPRVSARRAGSR